jgi:hypothetical protein
MADSDFPRGSADRPSGMPPADSQRLVHMPDSHDFDEFPSELGDAAFDGFPAEQADVLTFPVHQDRPPDAIYGQLVHDAPTSTQLVTLGDVLERHGGMDWRQCVGLVHQLCKQLKALPSRSPIVVEARNIQITESGDVRLLPSPTGGDPLVMQIGRLLRTMLMGRPAPPELRLLMAQATFELPIFESIDDVDRALQQVERGDQDRGAPEGATLNSAPVIPRFAPSGYENPEPKPVASSRPIRQDAHPRRRASGRLSPVGGLIAIYSGRVIAALVIIVGIAAAFFAGPSLVGPSRSTNPPRPSATSNRAIDTPVAPATPEPTGANAAPAPSPVLTSGLVERGSSSAPAPVHTPEPDSASLKVKPLREAPARAPRTAATPAVEPPPPPPIVPPRESERRAATLIAQGQTAEATQVFGAMLAANPLYEPKASDLTPESLTAFRSVQRQLLPQLAQRGFDRAKAALADGDVDRALTTGRETAAILQKPAAEPASNLRQPVQQLLDDALAAKANADEIIYTRADSGVVPPRPLSRQFPATTPIGVPPHRVGTLEMVISKEGTVEFVKLHTPLNRYHERMIVSAAKAWLYRPAVRAGKPVKFRLTVTINLPENGTD